MADKDKGKKKRKTENHEVSVKRRRTQSPNGSSIVSSAQVLAPGKILRIFVRNFMCHDALEINLNPNVNFIIGRNGSGKSAILTALTVGLGARAQVTNRGGAVKEFVKKGKASASIEITIHNNGPTAYKPEEYGDSIKVVRTIGNVSKYQLKSASGKIVSSRKDELARMLNTMNIQVENPVSVLNQDVSRSFLTTSSATDKYSLFVKATQIEAASNGYKEAQLDTVETRRRLEEAQAKLADSKKEVVALEKSMAMLESVESSREEVRQHELELCWANAIEEERKLARIEKILTTQQTNMTDIEAVTEMRESKELEIETNIEALKANIREIESEDSESSSAFNTANQRYQAAKESCSNKKRELMSAQATVKRTEKDILMLNQEIKRLESTQDGASEKALRREEAATKKQELEEIEAMLRTKQNEQMHFSTDKLRLEQEERNMKIEVQRHETSIRKTRQQLNSLKQQSDNALTVFGSDMPRLLKRIDEEHRKGRFKQKPVGPLGAYIKVKDKAWTPAIESYLKYGVLSAFAVDNGQDCKNLGIIMNEIFRGRGTPTIFSSPFFDQVHDVSQMCVRHPKYKNLFDMMEISSPVVANCLIDSQEPECVLLIPNTEEATSLLSDRRNVPANCRRGLTLEADEFFPDPQYRSYGGSVGKPKFLQVSTTDAIATLEEELGVAEEESKSVIQQHRIICEKLKRSHAQLTEVSSHVLKLKNMQLKKKTEIDRLADQLDMEEPDLTSQFIEEIAANESKLKEQKEAESRLLTEVEELQRELKETDVEVRRLRKLKESMDERVNKIKGEITNLQDQKEMFNLNNQRADRKLLEARQAVQKATADFEVQKRVTDKSVADAEQKCPRIDTERTPAEINRALRTLIAKIHAVEKNNGSKEDLQKELVIKRNKYNKDIKLANALQAFNDEHVERMKQRIAMYKELQKRITRNVQQAFTDILKLRHYEGAMKISHTHRSVELEITPHNTAKRATNDARTLSGGERSYSTIAFILALWECTGLPFYFLDEFDVFMDKVNRRIAMDLLLQHARDHPRCQFVFLTPLDTTITQVDDYLTIHQLAPPERSGNTQN